MFPLKYSNKSYACNAIELLRARSSASSTSSSSLFASINIDIDSSLLQESKILALCISLCAVALFYLLTSTVLWTVSKATCSHAISGTVSLPIMVASCRRRIGEMSPIKRNIKREMDESKSTLVAPIFETTVFSTLDNTVLVSLKNKKNFVPPSDDGVKEALGREAEVLLCLK
ncbi:unnamed protein product [Cylicocyclus nassatus]|uniref:Uncharacterized protein n=1 Tax=Cylicocyclus nassatus TaxID=53992 RepID=A0AA36M797_CYLNA|nr:unnamed protein product [Cylicocyclus nassatus]